MAPIRICQLITTLAPAGAERCVYELATRLDRNRFDVQVVGLRGGSVADELGAAGVRVRVINARSKWSLANPVKLRKLVRILTDQRIELLHTHLFHADLAGRLALRRADVPRLVHTVHVAEHRFRPWQFKFAEWQKGRCDRLVCVSDSVRQWHAAKSHLPADDYEVIPNGIDTSRFARDEAARREVRRQWGVGEGDVVAAFVGRLDRQKGIDVLVDAAGRLSERKDLHFVLAGDGPARGSVDRFCRKPAGRMCRALGFVDDVPKLLNAADLFVLPSRWEGWPLALGEAMAAGLAAVGTDCSGIRDVLVRNETGLLVAPKDPVALAGAILMLADDPTTRTKLAAAAQDRIHRHFTIQQFIARHEALYDSLTR